MKKTVVFGASPNPERYSFKAVTRLKQNGYNVIPVGWKKESISGICIVTDFPEQVSDLDTISLYINPNRQKEHYKYLLSLKPKRIIFNPGTENRELALKAKEQGIHVLEACTLVLLSTNQY